MTDRAGEADVPGRTAAHAYLFLAFTSVCFGANTTFAKLVVGEVSPMMVVALRWLLVVVLLVAFNRRALVRDWPNLQPHLGYLFAMGALGFAAFNGLFYIAAHYTTAVNMGIIQGVLPVFVLAGAWLAFRTPARALQWVGGRRDVGRRCRGGIRRRLGALATTALQSRRPAGVARGPVLRRLHGGIASASSVDRAWLVHRARGVGVSGVVADGGGGSLARQVPGADLARLGRGRAGCSVPVVSRADPVHSRHRDHRGRAVRGSSSISYRCLRR